MAEHKGTYSRGYLPHRDYAGSLQGITFRLGDSVPAKTITAWREELAAQLSGADALLRAAASEELRQRIARYEDAGYGACRLRDRRAAELVQEVIIAGHPERYRLLEWCVMPNHVHVLIRMKDGWSLPEVVRGWKGAAARAINRLDGARGPIWEKDYFDRVIRDEDHLWRAVSYIRGNPVKAGLCGKPEEWEFSSAGAGWDPDEGGGAG